MLLPFVFVGALSSLVLIFIGTGSTLVTLPLFSIIFPSISHHAISIHYAVGTCIAVNAVGAFMLGVSNVRRGNYDSATVIRSIVPVILGGLIAPHVLHGISSGWAKAYVGIIILTISLVAILKIRLPRDVSLLKRHPIIENVIFFLLALLAGTSGISLGIMLIPYLNKRLGHRRAVGTSAITASFYSILTALGYALLTPHHHVPYSIGYVYLPAFAVTSLTMLFLMKFGMHFSHKIEQATLKKWFYIVLLPVGSYVLISGVISLF